MIICPHCQNSVEQTAESTAEIVCSSCGSSFRSESEATREWSPQQHPRKLGRFELIDVIGIGAFGTVYKARDPELDRDVAIKVPRAGNLATGKDLDRFVREARSVAQLRHPSIVSVYEVGQSENLPYLVSEFVQGMTLSDLLSSRRVSLRESVQMITLVADALEYAHKMGVIHRDVKPANIMLDSVSLQPAKEQAATRGESHEPTSSRKKGGRYLPRLMDFGMAKRDTGDATMTMDGQVLGTPAYMSPEQARGEAHKVDGRSDVYSLGVILYQVLTSEIPFRGTTRALLHQVLNDEPRRPRTLNEHVPRDLETVCLKAMAKEPGRRYATAQEFADDLRRWLQGEPILARPVTQAERLWRWCRRNRALASLSAGVLLLLVLLATVASLAYVREAALRVDAEQQREVARIAENVARDAEAGAVKEAERTRRLLYTANMNLAEQAWEDNSLVRLRELLEETAQSKDRGFEWYYLQRLRHLQLLTLVGHRADVVAVTWSPDGRHIATGSTDRTLRIWDASSGREVRRVKAHAGSVGAVAFSPDGRRVATCSDEGTAKVWDADSGRLTVTFAEHRSHVTSVAFSPDGRHIITGSRDQTARVWDAASGRQLLSLGAHSDGVNDVAFAPDGRHVATASGDRTAKVWDAASGQETLSIAHPEAVSSITFSPDGQRLVTIGTDATVRVWDTSSGQELRAIKGHASSILSLACSADGTRIVTGSHDQTAKIWDVASGRELVTIRGHTQPVISVAFSPDGRRVLTGSTDGTRRVWAASCALCSSTLGRFTAWRFRATALAWSRAVGTARPRSGTSLREKCCSRSRDTKGPCAAWRSPPMGSLSQRALGTRRCGCGTRRRVAS